MIDIKSLDGKTVEFEELKPGDIVWLNGKLTEIVDDLISREEIQKIAQKVNNRKVGCEV